MPTQNQRRLTLTGTWILDKKRGEPSMRGYLETMGVSELAIVAHEKGEADHDTENVITLTDETYKIKKTSRVNDLEEELILGKECTKILPPGDREKWTLATSDGPCHVCVQTRMPTMNGLAEVTDIKRVLENESPEGIIMMQELTIKNVAANKRHTTTRFYLPRIDLLAPISSHTVEMDEDD